ncbi:sensor histidine kinase [Streptomyces natalensis]|uniref:sensor histidine kinase n=1 Tax=Streptomyces natalensis TaxID=68242 RepID=UPI000699C6E2|nr:histidine kinase [Streptomyces natalensis]
MIGRFLTNWRKRTRVQQVDAYFRWTLNAIPWLPVFACLQPVADAAEDRPSALALALVALGASVVQGCVMIKVLRHALLHYVGKGPAPRRLPAVSAALTVVVSVALGALMALTVMHGRDDRLPMMALAAMAAVTPFFLGYSLIVSKQRFMATLGLVGVVLTALGGLLTQMWGWSLFFGAYVVGAGLWSFVIGRPSGWTLKVFWELDAARSTQARLAVAEERLRFGRDLHDVMGRNLAVIALKSELAVQLARRGRPEAVDQMVEVQRIAQESQREVREVVRGYRKADLGAELAGARSILRAAGVDCRIEGEEGLRLEPERESALGWVVREGTTNVLRHAAEVRRCTFRTHVDAQRSVLVMTMENDGVAPPSSAALHASPASGLKGLRERLEPLGGTLAAGPQDGGRYRLTVELPVPDEARGGDQGRGGGPVGTGAGAGVGVGVGAGVSLGAGDGAIGGVSDG